MTFALKAVPILMLCLISGQRPGVNVEVSQTAAVKMMQAKGSFDIKLLPGTVDSGAVGVSRMVMEKQFHGELDGSSKGEMLSAGDPKAGNAGYVAIERVTGSLGGRSGSFALMQMGQMSTGVAPRLTMVVVPGSGTGDLSGIYGTMTIAVAGGQHSYTLDYAFSTS